MKLAIKDEIWILSDQRPGTASQAIGLAKEIGFDYKIIELSYSIFAKLPNCFFSDSLIRISSSKRREFKNLNSLPRLIISAGRKTAPIALFLKKLSQNRSKVIQIMNPNLNFKKFDLVILPKHDEVNEKKYQNLVTTIGSLTKINQKDIFIEQQKFASWFGDINKNIIVLMFGGSSKKTTFDNLSAKKLAQLSSKIAKNMKATLLILTSRRTSKELKETLKSNLEGDFRLFDWEEIKDNNPYLAIIGYANFFIITGDSVSMISECCSTGKPVYIFDEKNISSSKHRKFHKNLFTENYAKKLGNNLDFLENFSPKKLDETKRIALMIRKDFS